MITTDQHALCKLLAQWAGVEVREDVAEIHYEAGGSLSRSKVIPVLVIVGDWGEQKRWDPFADANKLELVKAGLRKRGYGYDVTWIPSKKSHRGNVWKPGEYDPPYYVKWHETEAMALALAIKAMEEGNV